jgi:hypothetical protein
MIRILNSGGISFESSTSSYRGSVNVNGVRYRTKRYETKRAAQLALTRLKKQILGSNQLRAS